MSDALWKTSLELKANTGTMSYQIENIGEETEIIKESWNRNSGVEKYNN